MNYELELAFAQDLAREAGKIMRQYFQSADLTIKSKSDNSPVTIADTTINALVIEKIRQQFPNDGVIGEEESYEPDRDRVWVCDPLDGTAPYSLGMPLSTFLLALVQKSDGQPVLAVCYEPFSNHMYWAIKGEGAYMNDNRLSITEQGAFAAPYATLYGMACENDVASYNPDTYASVLRKQGIRNFTISSGAYTMMKIAQEKFSVVVLGTPAQPWDVAAPALIIQEAGGIVTDLAGKTRRFDETGFGGVFAINRATHEQVINTIKRSNQV